ncbi:MAG: type II toxin-antitoxin system HicB family antitoxin [Oscillospiraceae bacterium]|nr:type II toxin-antitoxin system HicB family antitoxin [Oscillospiraceae bacterium]
MCKGSLDYYLNHSFRLEILPDLDEGGYIAKYPDLPGCITMGDTVDETIANAEDAKKEWINAALEDGVRF